MHRDAPLACEAFDRGAFGTVADQQQRRAVEAVDAVDGLVERVESSKASDPTDHEPALETETASQRVPVRTRPEQVQIGAGRCDHDATVVDTDASNLFGNCLRTAGDNIRAP